MIKFNMTNNKEIIIILDNIRSVLNVGAILRTADGAGVKCVYLCGITPQADHKKISKTALGAEEYVDIRYTKTTQEAIQQCKSEGFSIVTVEQTKNSRNYYEITLNEKVCFIFGNELTGVSPELLNLSDIVIELPMLGKKNSLNVATTVGIIIYHARTI